MPNEYIPSVEQGFRLGCQKGAKYGFPVVDIRATLLDGKAHDVDSSADTFKLAAMESFRDAQAKAGLVILEPIMNVVVHAPGNYLGELTRDVSRRRGEILNSSLDKGRCLLARLRPAGGAVRLHQRTPQLHQRHGQLHDGAEPLRCGEGRTGGYSGGELVNE